MRAAGIIAVLALAVASPVHAQADWQATAKADLEAARKVVQENHPGAAPEVKDAAFSARLEAGYRLGLARAATAARYEDYVAAMRTFTSAVGDPHVMWGPTAPMQSRTPPEPGPPRGSAGFGARLAEETLWIALGSLDSRAAPILDGLRSNPKALADAGRIVVDLRGNSGGDENRGVQLAELIFGPQAVSAARRKPPQGCPASLIRAAPGALRRLETAGAVQEAAGVRAALADGRAFAQPIPPVCLQQRPETPAPAASRGRVVILTDGGCMSSCPGMVDLFRRLGAVHVGHATKPRLWYQEADVETLPSGLGVIQFVRRIAFFWPARTEPYEPAHRFDGDIADHGAVRAWVASLSL